MTTTTTTMTMRRRVAGRVETVGRKVVVWGEEEEGNEVRERMPMR
jgi:hypothetical protein